MYVLTLFSMGGGGIMQPPYSFSLISPERLELRPSNFLTFSFYLLAIRKIQICYFGLHLLGKCHFLPGGALLKIGGSGIFY